MEIFKLFGEVVVNAKDAIEALNETTEHAEETAESVGDVGKESKQAGKTTTNSLVPIPPKFLKVATAAGAVVTTVIAFGKAMVDLANDTREYRVEMAKLETAFTVSGHTGETATEVYRELHSVLGETDQAVEAANHLAKLCTTQEELRAMTTACTGAFASWGASLPIEGLTEAANETAKTGVLTGQLVDALVWAGISEEEFQEKLNACNNERERATLIIEEMVDLYGEVGEVYKETNKDAIQATSAQEKLNEAQARWGKLAEPIATAFTNLRASVSNALADVVETMGSTVTEKTEAIVGLVETSEEAAAKIAEYRAQLEEMEKAPLKSRTAYHQQDMNKLRIAIANTETQYERLKEAEQKAAEEAAAAAASTADSTEQFSLLTEQYVADASALMEKFGETYTQVYSKVTGWFEPFEKASVTVNTSITKMIEGMQSQIDFNNQYSANLQYLKEQGLGGLADAFQAYGAEGSAYAQTVATALQKAGGSATEEGQKIIAEFQAISDAQLQSQQELSNTLALANGEIEAEMQSVTDNYAEKIAELDMSSEALTNAKNTMSSFQKGISDGVPGILSKMSELGKKMTSALQNSLGTVTVTVKANLNSSSSSSSSAYGSSMDAFSMSSGAQASGSATAFGTENTNGGGMVINQYIETVAQTPVELAAATEAYFVQARWAMA